METNNIEKISLIIQNDRLKVENILLSAGIQPKELKEVEYVFSSSDAYNKVSKQALIQFFQTRKELLVLIDEYIDEIKKIRRD